MELDKDEGVFQSLTNSEPLVPTQTDISPMLDLDKGIANIYHDSSERGEEKGDHGDEPPATGVRIFDEMDVLVPALPCLKTGTLSEARARDFMKRLGLEWLSGAWPNSQTFPLPSPFSLYQTSLLYY